MSGELTAFGLKAFLTLLVVIDPVGVAPAFVGLAGERPPSQRAGIAAKAVLVASAVLVAFTLGGNWLLGHLGISLHAFRVAGGVLLFRIAMDMVLAQHERETKAEEEEARSRRDISVFPLAIPLIAGPGALASAMILAGEARGLPLGVALELVMLAVVLALCYVALRVAGTLSSALGQTGINVVTRVLGVLLAALAVQYVADGARGLLSS